MLKRGPVADVPQYQDRHRRARSIAVLAWVAGSLALAVTDQQLWPRIAQYRGDLAGAGARADADNDGAATFHGDEQQVDSRGVAVPHRDSITSGNADTGQLLRESSCRSIEFTPGERLAGVIDVGEAVRALLGVAGYRVGQRHVRPPAGGAIPGRLLVSECRRAHSIQAAGAHHPMIWRGVPPASSISSTWTGIGRCQAS